MRKRVFVSFADSGLARSSARLDAQVRGLEFFDEIQIFDELVLNQFPLESAKDLFRTSVRGFGYWIWKPFVVLKVLEELEDGDLLLYADAGCHLNPGGLGRLEEYFELGARDRRGILCFAGKPPIESIIWDGRPLTTSFVAQRAKGDLLDFFHVRNDDSVLYAPMVAAGVLVIRNSEWARNFLSEWLQIMVDNIRLVDDSPSKSPNHPWFIENRHDQAVFTLMAIRDQLTSISASEIWYPTKNCPNIPDWKALSSTPIHARRDKDRGGRSSWRDSKLGRVKVVLKTAIRAIRTCL